MNDLRESLAALCHKQWSGWMEYLFSLCTPSQSGGMIIPEEFVRRWQHQMRTDYVDLSVNEQNSDRKEADKFLGAILSCETTRRPDIAAIFFEYLIGHIEDQEAQIEDLKSEIRIAQTNPGADH